MAKPDPEITPNIPEPDDPFDLVNLRLDQAFVQSAGVKKLVTTVPVRKPLTHDFFRVHSDPEFRSPLAIIELKDADREIYLIPPRVAVELPGEFAMAMIHTVINRQGVISLWPVRLPSPDGKIMEWHRSAAEAAELAMRRWIRIKANMSLGAYEIFEAASTIADPVWPDLSFKELLRVGFRDRFVSNLDHPAHREVARRLMMLDDLPFRYIVPVDFEFEFGGHASFEEANRSGERPRVVCMVAKELRSGQEWRLSRGEFGPRPPFPTGADALIVPYYGSAELGCFRTLSWDRPANVLDLFVEFRNRANGLTTPAGFGLIGALTYFGLDTLCVTEKDAIRLRILEGGPWSHNERGAFLDYCATDIVALAVR